MGDRVALLTSADGKAASKVLLVPGEPQREHRVLTVISVSGKQITPQDAAGMAGKLVIFIGAKGGESDRFKANSEVTIEQVLKRLEDHAKKADVDEKGSKNGSDKDRNKKAKLDLQARLEANMKQRLDLFAQIIARAPESARPALQTLLDNTLRDCKAELMAAGGARLDVDAKLDKRGAEGTVTAIEVTAGTLTLKTRDRHRPHPEGHR